MSAQSSTPNKTPHRTKAEAELSAIRATFTTDPQGIFALGRDGVLRSLTADRKILNAAGLSPPQIKALLDLGPFDQQTEDKFRGVDGTKTPVSKWWEPDEGVLPEPLGEAEREEEKRDWEESVREGKVGKGCCGVREGRKYDLGPEAESA